MKPNELGGSFENITALALIALIDNALAIFLALFPNSLCSVASVASGICPRDDTTITSSTIVLPVIWFNVLLSSSYFSFLL